MLVQFEATLVAGYSFVNLFQRNLTEPQVSLCIEVVRLELQGVAVPFQRRLGLAASFKRVAEIVGDFRLSRKQAKRLLHKSNRGCVVPALGMQQAEHVQCHGVLWILREELAVERISPFKPTRFMCDDGLLQQGGQFGVAV